MSGYINLVKLCVGTEKVDDLIAWQQMRAQAYGDGLPRHVTRMWPKRESELINGGSLYWVFKGVILARQRVVRLEEVRGEDGIRRCAIVLDPQINRTQSAPRRPFQGWRYLQPEDSPPDLKPGREHEDQLPEELETALAELGIF